MAQCAASHSGDEGEEGGRLVEKESAEETQHQVFFRAAPLRTEKLEKFQIVFNNPTATYFAGETVYGYAWIVVKEALYVQSICLEAIGEAKVEWMTSSDIQASDEEVFNHTTVLPIKGEKQINDEGILHTGSHYFPFEFSLPPKLPSSFKGKHGRLRYYVRMTLYTHGFFTSAGSLHAERTSKFAVIGALDLNSEPDASLPVENDAFETVGSWCCVAGTVTALLRLERKGFVIKEAIPVWAQVRNLSARTIRRTMISLIQNVTYYSYRGRFSESTTLVTMYKGSVAPRGKQTWNRELLSVPTVPPSHLRGCKIIDIQYSIELCIKPAGLARRIRLPVDIVIGTVPLRDRQHRVTCHPLLHPQGGDSSAFPFPFFSDTSASDQVYLSDMSFHNMVPTAPPWEEDDDIP
ncbi:arrestin domain-containing protein 3-like [Babylonia areolata]|uniref:arrestin domain-containing protein 3-like n=1 Tax=Babylonia areolata TaxID=304850 RepID=UPI003FD4E121